MNPTHACLALLLVSALCAQRGPQEAWQEFTRSHPGDWSVEWNPATGTPSAIFGPGLVLGTGEVASLDAAQRESAALLARFADLLGRGESKFVENIGVKASRVWVFVYDQEYAGLPVIGGRADVRLHEVGTVALFGSSAVQIPQGFVTTPKLDPDRARTIGQQHVLGAGAAAVAGAPVELVIWADTASQQPTRATLAFEVQIDQRPQETVVGKVYVDAATGAVLQWKNEVYDCRCGARHASGGSSRHASRLHRAALLRELAQPGAVPAATPAKAASPAPLALTGRVMAWTNIGILPTSPLTNIPMPRLRVSSSAGSVLTDANGDFSIPYTGTTPVLVTASLEGRHSQIVRVAQGTQLVGSATVTPGTNATIQIGTQNMGELDRSQPAVYWHVDYVNEWIRGLLPGATGPMDRISGVSPRVNINSNCNAYYTQNTINFYTSGGGCNMTAYQTVIVHEWGHGLDDAFGGISQTDGLSEGWGDLLAVYQSRQPELGPGFRVGNNNGIRTALNTRTYPAGGGVHQQGETWMGWAWDVRNNLMTTLGAAAGEARSHTIVAASIAADATNQPNAVREVFVLDDDDGNLNNGTPNYLDLEKACLKRNLPYPRRNRSELATFGVGCPSGSQGDQVCTSSNWAQPLSNRTTAASRVGIYFLTQGLTNLTGVELFTQARTAATTVTVTIHEFDTTTVRPSNTVVATGQVSVGTTLGTYRAKFTNQLLIPVPKSYCLVFDNADKLILPATSAGSPMLFWEFTSAWSAPQVANWRYQLICDSGFQTPAQTVTTPPVIGTTFRSVLSNAPFSRPAVFVLGVSNTTWGGVALPWNYAPNCNLYTSLEVMVFQRTDPAGSANIALPIPNQLSVVGFQFFTQYFVAEPVNALGLIATGAVRGKVGEY